VLVESQARARSLVEQARRDAAALTRAGEDRRREGERLLAQARRQAERITAQATRTAQALAGTGAARVAPRRRGDEAETPAGPAAPQGTPGRPADPARQPSVPLPRSAGKARLPGRRGACIERDPHRAGLP
jgi:hypothetical protein